jgi:hypothetical protein
VGYQRRWEGSSELLFCPSTGGDGERRLREDELRMERRMMMEKKESWWFVVVVDVKWSRGRGTRGERERERSLFFSG